MPTTRRSAGASARGRSGPPKGQSTISFAHRVTKSVPVDSKKAKSSTPDVAKIEPVEAPVPEDVKEVVVEEPQSQDEADAATLEPEVPEKTEAELQAEKLSDAKIAQYWKGIEKERIAPRVHQKELTTSEKMLRYFDVSSQYGPCIGVTRMRRWYRAERLGLNPPIEVLAVLLREEKQGTAQIETAQMDKILNSTAVGAQG